MKSTDKPEWYSNYSVWNLLCNQEKEILKAYNKNKKDKLKNENR